MSATEHISEETRIRLSKSDSIIIWARLLGWVWQGGNEVSEAKHFITTYFAGFRA